jgi:hypothetical protein
MMICDMIVIENNTNADFKFLTNWIHTNELSENVKIAMNYLQKYIQIYTYQTTSSNKNYPIHLKNIFEYDSNISWTAHIVHGEPTSNNETSVGHIGVKLLITRWELRRN